MEFSHPERERSVSFLDAFLYQSLPSSEHAATSSLQPREVLCNLENVFAISTNFYLYLPQCPCNLEKSFAILKIPLQSLFYICPLKNALWKFLCNLDKFLSANLNNVLSEFLCNLSKFISAPWTMPFENTFAISANLHLTPQQCPCGLGKSFAT